MSCEKILDKVYEYSGGEPDSMSLLTRIHIGLHLLVCPDCAQEVERFEVCRDILHSEFLPPAPGLEDTVMAMIAAENGKADETEDAELPGGFSLRGWIIAGLVMLVSLATAFFGLDFNKVALAAGMSFMIPVGITFGIALTCYGALFIGSHLKELTERFGL
ncbi:MAG: peptidoglycan-binding protein [Treponema sp.]|jgi:hypothetical protein|nr:peptidoglycan-binding protein [Treponema sp.]